MPSRGTDNAACPFNRHSGICSSKVCPHKATAGWWVSLLRGSGHPTEIKDKLPRAWLANRHYHTENRVTLPSRSARRPQPAPSCSDTTGLPAEHDKIPSKQGSESGCKSFTLKSKSSYQNVNWMLLSLHAQNSLCWVRGLWGLAGFVGRSLSCVCLHPLPGRGSARGHSRPAGAGARDCSTVTELLWVRAES